MKRGHYITIGTADSNYYKFDDKYVEDISSTIFKSRYFFFKFK